MTIHPEKLAAVPEGGLATNTAVDISFEVDETTNKEKERPKKRHSSLNPTISTTITMGDDSSTSDATASDYTVSDYTAGASTAGASTAGASSTTSGNNKKAGAKVCTIPPSSATNNPFPNAAGPLLSRDASSRNDVGGGAGGKPRLQERWTKAEEKRLVSAVATLGTTSWAKIAVNVPGRNEIQCSSSKWQYLLPKRAAAAYC
jgi:hypothetical protein